MVAYKEFENFGKKNKTKVNGVLKFLLVKGFAVGKIKVVSRPLRYVF